MQRTFQSNVSLRAYSLSLLLAPKASSLSSAWSYMGRLCQSIGRTLQTGTLHQSRLEQMTASDDESAFVDEDCESSDDDGLLKFQQP
ncbi:unnamed protein product [Brassica rapa]|uniref:Uncharacterized protein n=1 Tax=Brassica campestris TaxID=3711 RepID=A0A8D9HAF1_BRACM|nr:unnamed protein product [Brassica rapa]